jgi:hypothetical protein
MGLLGISPYETARNIASHQLLDDLGVQLLDRIPSFEVFHKLANAMHAAEKSAA